MEPEIGNLCLDDLDVSRSLFPPCLSLSVSRSLSFSVRVLPAAQIYVGMYVYVPAEAAWLNDTAQGSWCWGRGYRAGAKEGVLLPTEGKYKKGRR